uniref:CGG triplet repeat-binding protein 1 n=1 Tax=Salarias fasciatus TaxID=181472 RepID=A0A672FVW9_SALFA
MKRQNSSHLPPNISARDRANQYPGILHESGGKLFCTPCNLVLEHKRKSSVLQHFATAKHTKRLADGEKSSKQLTLTEAATSKTLSRATRNESWVATCTAVNIPLSKSDHPVMRKFLQENVINGGAIPGFHQLQEQYLSAVYEKKKEDSTQSCTIWCG